MTIFMRLEQNKIQYINRDLLTLGVGRLISAVLARLGVIKINISIVNILNYIL